MNKSSSKIIELSINDTTIVSGGHAGPVSKLLDARSQGILPTNENALNGLETIVPTQALHGGNF